MWGLSLSAFPLVWVGLPTDQWCPVWTRTFQGMWECASGAERSTEVLKFTHFWPWHLPSYFLLLSVILSLSGYLQGCTWTSRLSSFAPLRFRHWSPLWLSTQPSCGSGAAAGCEASHLLSRVPPSPPPPCDCTHLWFSWGNPRSDTLTIPLTPTAFQIIPDALERLFICQMLHNIVA